MLKSALEHELAAIPQEQGFSRMSAPRPKRVPRLPFSAHALIDVMKVNLLIESRKPGDTVVMFRNFKIHEVL